MSVSTPVSQDSPLWLSWVAYKATPEYENTKRWAIHPEHTEGSLWAAFEAGFNVTRNICDTCGEAYVPVPPTLKHNCRAAPSDTRTDR